MKTILVPVDLSTIGERVLEEAARLAKALRARVVVLTVVQPPVLFGEYTIATNVAELMEAAETQAQTQLARFGRLLRDLSIATELVQVTGFPATHILAEAEKCAADYIVMGSHGHTAFYDLLVGSTTHGVLLKAACPVVIVPAKRTTKRNPTDERTAEAR